MDDTTVSLIREWIHKAEHDLGMAELALANKPEFTDSICNHCQQAAEKYLKAYLVFLDIKFAKKHDLDYLLDLAMEKDAGIKQFYDLVEELDAYAVEVRYPDDWFEPTYEEAQKAVEIANSIKGYVFKQLSF